ncbi:MAG: mucoidy inhibitor MuiA family protein [Turneriella sp.]
MKKIILASLALGVTLNAAALEKVTGKVESVTIFTDRALVKRAQIIDSDAQTGTLRFTALPQSLVSDSVRASGVGVNVTGVALRYVEKVAGEEWADHPIKKKIIKVEQQMREEGDLLSNYREQLRVIDSMMKLTTSQSDRESRHNALNVDSWEKALAFLEGRRTHYHEKIRRSDDKLEKLRKELSKLNVQFNADTQVAKTAATEVEVSYARAGRDGGKIELEYMVTNVSWTSVYDLRGSAEGSEFQLASHAIIRQNTGENWKNASVTLSTARPSTSMTPGILTPWRVSQSAAFPGRPDKGATGKTANVTSRDEAGEASVESSSMADTSDTTTVSITLPGRENIMSDNSDHRVTLSVAPLKGSLTHVAVPSLSSYVYLKARLKNTSSAPVMGTMNAFLDGSFVGAITLRNPAAVGEEFDVFLGVDQRMQLKRVLKRGDVEKSGLFGGKVEVVNQWEIEVSNFTKKTRQIVVYDQFPVSADPSISTKYIGASRSEAQKDANGILTWKLDVKPGEKIKFDFSYSLTFPKETWEKFTRAYDNNAVNEEQYYDQLSNKPAAAQAPRQYNLERMMQKSK